MSRYIDADALYEKTAEWEAQALHMVELHINDEDKTEWKRWSFILKERSAFKFDIADSPTADVVSKEKYNELNDRYHRLLESAKILSDAFCEYERIEDENRSHI